MRNVRYVLHFQCVEIDQHPRQSAFSYASHKAHGYSFPRNRLALSGAHPYIYIYRARSLSEWSDCHIRMANTYIYSCALFGKLTARIINNTLLRADGIIVQSHFHFQAHHLIYWRFTCARLCGQAFSSRVVVRVTDFPRYFQKTTSPNTHKTPQLHWLIAFSGRVHH